MFVEPPTQDVPPHSWTHADAVDAPPSTASAATTAAPVRRRTAHFPPADPYPLSPPTPARNLPPAGVLQTAAVGSIARDAHRPAHARRGSVPDDPRHVGDERRH